MARNKRSSYGYNNRADQPERIVPIAPQATPLGDLPRGVEAAIKNPVDAVVRHYAIQYAKQVDNSRLMAPVNLDNASSGGGGAATVTSSSWYSRVARWVRKVDFAHSGGGFGFEASIINLDYSLFNLISASAQPGQYVFRFEDIIAGDLVDNTGSETCSSCMHFGLRHTNTLTTLTPDSPFIGFYYSIGSTVGGGTHYGNWYAGVWGNSGGGGDSVDTGITSQLPHRLTCDIDLSDGSATFYIDGVQVKQVTAFATAMTHSNDDGGLQWIVGGGGSGVHNGTGHVGFHMEKVNHGIRILDEAA